MRESVIKKTIAAEYKDGDKIVEALDLASQGLRVFPVKSKKPLIKDYKNKATTNPSQIKNWSEQYPECDWAVLAGIENKLVVLDFDVKNGKQGFKSYKELRLRGLPKTRTINTVNGGLHLYYEYVPGIHNKVEVLPGLDVRSDGGYVVAVADGYTVKDDLPIAALPGNIQSELQQVKYKKSGTVATEATEFDLESARAALNTIPIAELDEVSPAGWGDHWLRVGMALFHVSGGSNTAFDLFNEWSSSGCKYPGRDALKKRWDSFGSYDGWPVTAATLYYIARQYDRKPSKQPQKAQLLFVNAPDELTQLAFANEIAQTLAPYLRYVVELGEWRSFNQETGLFEANIGVVEAITREMIDAAKSSCYKRKDLNEDTRIEKLKHLRNISKSSFIVGVANLLRTYKVLQASATEFNRDDLALCLPGGQALVLKTDGTHLVRPAIPEDHFTMVAGVKYEAKAACPTFSEFLNRACGGDVELVRYLLKFFALCLTGKTELHALHQLVGPGGTGKSTVVSVLQSLLDEYQTTVSPEMFITQSNPGCARPDLIAIMDKRLVVSTEMPANKRFDASIGKALTGDDIISARPLYGRSINFKPKAKFLLVGNYLLNVLEVDSGTWRRLRVVPFTSVAPQQDPTLKEKLLNELPGILNLLLNAWADYCREGLQPCNKIADSSSEYQQDSDILQGWIDECCEQVDVKTPTATLFLHHQAWLVARGLSAGNTKSFGRALKAKGFEPKTGAGGKRCMYGIALKS